MTAIDIDSLQATNFEFDIEANRRRRAELANDVTELISISKFFLQHYSSDSPEDMPPMPRKSKEPIATKCEKNAANANKVRARYCGRITQARKSPVANATPTHVKRKQTRINNGRGHRMRGNDDDVPPLFDKIKLHQYCVDIVDRFFHGPPPNDSDFSESPKIKSNNVKKEQSIEKSVQTISNNRSNEIILSKPKKNSKYALVPSRYMNKTPPKSTQEQAIDRNTSPYRLVSAKSREILEQVARNGTEIRRHSCLTHHKERSITHRDQCSTHEDARSQLKFRDIHPTIELIPSNAIFPKRIIKQPEDSQQISSAENKSDDKDRGCVHENVNNQIGAENNFTSNSIIEVKNSPNSDQRQRINTNSDENERRDEQQKAELKLQQLPVLSIKPETKCEIENIYEIEIKPDETKARDFFPKDKNKVIELVYESTEKEIDEGALISDVPKNAKNKYIAPFNENMRAFENSLAENATTDDTREPSNLSLNLSSTSHLTDDEKFHSDKKKASAHSIDVKTPARNMIDKILEAEVLEEQNDEKPPLLNECDVKTQRKSQDRSHNFDDLREILRRIRSDKTTLDVAIDSTTPPELMSPARIFIDREVQCDDLSKTESMSLKIDLQTPKKDSAKKTDFTMNSPHYIDSSIIESPKFAKTIESIRSSARKLDFNMSESEYRTATREQIEKAAKKFLKSILKNADDNAEQSVSDHGDRHIHLKMGKPNYRIVDDQIIQSNFNLKSNYGGCTSSSSSDTTSLHLKLPNTQLLDHRFQIKCNNWIDRTDSESTANSIEEFLNDAKQPQQIPLINVQTNYDDLSDGEILSDGEFHIP